MGRQSEDHKAMLRSLRRWSQLSAKFKLIIRSRPEDDIVATLSPTSYLIDLPSGAAVTPKTSEDIRTFFIHRFVRLRRATQIYESGIGLAQLSPMN